MSSNTVPKPSPEGVRYAIAMHGSRPGRVRFLTPLSKSLGQARERRYKMVKTDGDKQATYRPSAVYRLRFGAVPEFVEGDTL